MGRIASTWARVAGLSVALAVALGPIAAAPAGASTGAPAPAPARAAERAPTCALSASLDYSSGEQASCIAAGAKLSRVPTVGQTATLKVTVEAARAEPAVAVTIDLPPTIAFADGTATNAAVDGTGRIARAHAATLKLAAGERRTFTRVVRAIGSGFGEITVSANDRLSAARTDGGTTSVFLTTGATENASFLGRAASTEPLTVARHDYPSAGPETARGRAKMAAAPPSVARAAGHAVVHPNTAGTACATGTWNYVDQNGSSRPAFNTLVEVLNSGNTLLSYAVSAGDGSYNICWSTGGVTQSVYVKFVESNNAWKLVDGSGNTYSFSTAITSIPDGTSHNFGSLYPGSSSYYRGLHAFDEADDEYQWIYQSSGTGGAGCWSPFQSTCQQLVIHWTSDSTTGTYWNSTGAYLLAGSPDTLDEPVHEYGHALMYDLYDQNFPATTNCSPHYLFTAGSATCGFTEGWADWVATSVYNNLVWTFNGGSTTSFDVTWNEGLGYDTGDQVEGRIVMALRSLTDGVKAPWDNDPGEGSGIRDASRFFTVLADYRPNTLSDFWNDRALVGQDTSQTALSALYQGTIDYGFRNPLASTVARHLPEAVPDHNYSFTASSGFWSLVAVKPDVGSDVDLSVFSDFGQSALVSSSSFGGTAIDLVGVNTNVGHLGSGAYYPRVHEFAGTGGYTIESISGASTLSLGTASTTLSASQLAALYDSNQTAGVPLYLRAVPAAGQDVQIGVMSADLNSASRSASSLSTDPGAGNAATLVYTPTATGWHGLYLLNNAGTAGTATVYADTSGPTGAVVIKGGATTTTKPQVGLTLSASDAQTGVMAMQVSTDGTFDTEPVLPYATTTKVRLAGTGNGTKTVFARFENNAGEWSTPVTDTIDLESLPLIKKVDPASGSTAGGNTVTITGTYLNGVSAVKFGTVPATSFHIVSSTKITAIAPAHGPANVTVKLTNGTGDSAGGATAAYKYVAPPTITAVAPASGSHTGGTPVTITGTGFTGATVVLFGTVPAASFTVKSATKITAVSPAEPSKRIDVRVTAPGGTSAKVTADHYRFT